MPAAARVLASAGHLSLGEFFGLYPPRLYFIAWVPRVLFQLIFFALVAQFLGGRDYLAFVVVGSVAHATYIGALGFTIASITWEQGTGTVPLLVASPTHPVLVFIGRNLAMLGNGVVSGILSLALAVVVLDLRLTAAQLVACIAILVLMTASLYCLGLLLGSVVLRFAEYRNVVSSLATIGLTFLAGPYVPVAALPEWVRPVSEILPVTNGLRALRSVTFGTPADVPTLILVEVVIAAGYFGLALMSFGYFLRAARTRGTLDFH